MIKCLATTLLLTVALVGCTGARTEIRFDETRYPISMSAWVPDETGRPLGPDDLEVVGKFKLTGRRWSLIYTAVPLGWPIDLSEEINAAIEKAGGEAVVNLDVQAGLPFFPDLFPGGLFLHWLPVWPGSIIGTIDGDIVRRKPPPPDEPLETGEPSPETNESAPEASDLVPETGATPETGDDAAVEAKKE